MSKFCVIKKDGSKEPFDASKIIECVKLAANRINVVIPKYKLEALEDDIYNYFSDDPVLKNFPIYTKDLHSIVIRLLEDNDLVDVANSYKEYRDYKTSYAASWEHIRKSADDILYLGDRENANFDSSLSSTKGSLIRGAATKELYKQFYLTKEENRLIERGDIYIHDLRDMILNNINCCLFDMGNVLRGGFEMSNVKYTEPKSVLSALQVIGDITLVATAQQFGGFTIPEIDKILLPYCKKTLTASYDEGMAYGMKEKDAHDYAWERMLRELEQGFQSLELKLNTVPCSRGDFAFTTLTFGQWSYPDEVNDCYKFSEDEKQILETICKVILHTRMKGHGGKPVVFPKLVYLYDKDQITNDTHSQRVFDECIRCSCQCMYPDYLSLNHGKVADIYKRTGAITSPMGCRAYLTEWHDPKTGEAITTGRCNIGAVSLNLPLLWEVSKNEGISFHKIIEERFNTIIDFFERRYKILADTKACTNPLAFCQGGLYEGNLNPDDKIGNLTRYMTASIGVTALHELKEISLDNSIGIKVLNYLNRLIEDAKERTGHLYALYGTPAESLCQTQAEQYNKYVGKHVYDYFTNSFHRHVSEDITPFEKQDLEEWAFHQVNGGHIQYVRLDNPENFDAAKAIIQRGMLKGFYQGVNFDSAYCNSCGKHSTNVMWKCPHCGSSDLTVISRVCGYLGYSNVNGHSRMNDGKMKEISERKSM